MIENEIPLKQKLNLETAKISWKELQVFFAKGSLLQIEATEDLLSVAELIAANDESAIESLILNQKIGFATPEWVKNNCTQTTPLWTLVIAPYVLCQLAK